MQSIVCVFALSLLSLSTAARFRAHTGLELDSATASSAATPLPKKKLSPKVVIISMFGPEADAWKKVNFISMSSISHRNDYNYR